jgi:hypothetical protein
LRKIKYHQYENSVALDHFPWVDNYDYFARSKEKFIERRQKMLLKGTKVGLRKGGETAGKMSIFDTKKSPTPSAKV